MILHWAVNAWNEPEKATWPAGTNAVDGKAVQTPFEGGRHVRVVFSEENCPNRSASLTPDLSLPRMQHAWLAA